MEAEITNRGKRDYKLGQGFQIGPGITNRCRTQRSVNRFFSNSSYEAGCFFTLQLLKFNEKLNY